MRRLRKESLRVVLLDTRYQLIRVEEISLGSINESIAHPRDVLRPALVSSAYALVIVHNHPSGDASPSQTDHSLTRGSPKQRSYCRSNCSTTSLLARPRRKPLVTSASRRLVCFEHSPYCRGQRGGGNRVRMLRSDPTRLFGPDVRIGPGTVVRSHAVIDRFVRIGRGNVIGPGCVIGAAPQDLSFTEERRTTVEIGDDNVIREHCTITPWQLRRHGHDHRRQEFSDGGRPHRSQLRPRQQRHRRE